MENTYTDSIQDMKDGFSVAILFKIYIYMRKIHTSIEIYFSPLQTVVLSAMGKY